MTGKEGAVWAIVLLAALLFLFGGFGGYGGMRGMMYGTYGSGMMFFGWIYGVLVFVALILLIIWLYRQMHK